MKMEKMEWVELSRAIQRAVGATEDGEVGPDTLRRVYAKLAGREWQMEGAVDSMERAGSGAGAVAGELVRLAKGEVGVREEPRNSNHGGRVDEYQRADWIEGEGYAWCAAFICWLFLQASKKLTLGFERPKTAGAWDFENWAREQAGKGVRLIKPAAGTKVQAGDIVVFTFSHIGLAVGDESGGLVPTIEGNTNGAGSREGDGVYQKSREKAQIRSIIRVG